MPAWSDQFSGIHALLGKKLGVTGRDLREQVGRAGRRLPRRARRDAEVLVRAETMARHPRFARLIDPREVRRAERRLTRLLRSIDPRAQRRARRLDALARAGLYVLVTSALVVTLLWWRGLV